MPRPRLDHVRKAQILSAAAEVLSERGYANSRVVDIAKTAGTSPAAILYWFDGKDGLLAEALRLREQEFHDRYTVKAENKATAQRAAARAGGGDAAPLRLEAVDGAVRAGAPRQGGRGRTRPHGSPVACSAARRDSRRPGDRRVRRLGPRRDDVRAWPRCSTGCRRCWC